MIKRFRVPTTTLVEFCAKNDLTIILTSDLNETIADIQAGTVEGGEEIDELDFDKYEKKALVKLTRKVSGRELVLGGKDFVFPNF